MYVLHMELILKSNFLKCLFFVSDSKYFDVHVSNGRYYVTSRARLASQQDDVTTRQSDIVTSKLYIVFIGVRLRNELYFGVF